MFLYVQNRFNPEPRLSLLPPHDTAPRSVQVPYIDAPLMVLPRSIDAFRQTKKGKYWRKQSWSVRKFDDQFGPVTFAVLTEPAALEHWLPEVHALFRRRWEDGATRSAWASDAGFAPYRRAMIELAASGEASLAVLYRGQPDVHTGELLAYGYLLEQDRTLYFYQHAASVRDDYRSFSLGTRFLIDLLEHCIASERFDAFDFMVGVVPYKLQWASCVQRVYQRFARDDHPSELAYRLAVGKARATALIRNSPRASALARGWMRRR